MSYTKGYRYKKVPGTDNAYAIPHKEIQNPAYAATISLSVDAEETIIDHAQLTGDLTETINTTLPFTGDKVRMLYSNDATIRTVTFSTGFIAGSTLQLPASSQGSIDFVFMGSVQKWVETSRMIFV